MKRNSLTIRSATVAVAVCLICCSLSLGEKPDRKPGGGGGGGGTGDAAYTIIPFLPTDFQSTRSYVIDLNEVSHAVGTAVRSNGEDQAVHLDIATGVYTSLKSDSLPSGAHGVNDHNQIVGQVYYDGAALGAFWSSPSADPVPLLPLDGDVDSWVAAINDVGIVVGESADENGNRMGVVWRVVVDASGAHVDGPLALPPFDGDSASWAVDVNATIGGVAQVAGTSERLGYYEAVVWSVELNSNGTLGMPGAPRGLGTLGVEDPSQSMASSINNSGTVCGDSDWWPFIAPAGGAVQPLEVPRKSVGGFAADVNDHGQAVGMQEIWSAGLQLGVDYAYLWKDGDVIDLSKQIPGSSGWGRLKWAYRINDAGIIAGWGEYDVNERGFLLIPSKP